jgi:hypothetical protein
VRGRAQPQAARDRAVAAYLRTAIEALEAALGIFARAG